MKKAGLSISSSDDRYSQLRQLASQLVIASIATCIFFASLLMGAVKTLAFDTIPRLRLQLNDRLSSNYTHYHGLVLDHYRRLEQFWPVRLVLNVVQWELSLVYWAKSKFDSLFTAVMDVHVVREIREHFDDSHLEWRSGVVEFCYSFAAMVIVCNLVLARFAVVSIYNLRAFIPRFSTTSSADTSSKNHSPSNSGASSAFEKMSDYGQRFATPNWKSDTLSSNSSQSSAAPSMNDNSSNKRKRFQNRAQTMGEFHQGQQHQASKKSSPTRPSLFDVFEGAAVETPTEFKQQRRSSISSGSRSRV